jgi:hypothetical protein
MADLDLARDLDRAKELLPAEKLRGLEQLAQQDKLTDAAMQRELGRTGIALVALTLTDSSDKATSLEEVVQYSSKLDELRGYLLENAPSLLKDQRLIDIAKNITRRPTTDEEEESSDPFFHRVSRVRSVALYAGAEDSLYPLVRTEIVDENRDVIAMIVVGMHDHVFVAEAFLDNLNKALLRSAALIRAGLLDLQEMSLIQQRLDDIEARTKEIRERLEEARERGRNKT